MVSIKSYCFLSCVEPQGAVAAWRKKAHLIALKNIGHLPDPNPYWDRHSGHANPDPADPEIRIVINSKLMNFNMLSKILKIFTL
jgi:hypothetical protein